MLKCYVCNLNFMDELSAKMHRELTTHHIAETDDEILKKKPSLKFLHPQQS